MFGRRKPTDKAREERILREATREAHQTTANGYADIGAILGSLGSAGGIFEQILGASPPQSEAERKINEQKMWASFDALRMQYAQEAQERAQQEQFSRNFYQEFRSTFGQDRARERAKPPPRSRPAPDPWKVLGISSLSATHAQVERAFKRAALKAHPDHGGSHEEMVRLNDARRDALRDVSGRSS